MNKNTTSKRFFGLQNVAVPVPPWMQLSAEVIRLSDEQQRIKEDMEAKQTLLQQRLSEQQRGKLLQVQQQADGRLTELRQHLANKQPLLQQATSSLDIVRLGPLSQVHEAFSAPCCSR